MIGATRLIAFEAPPLTDELLSAPRLSVVAAGGPGWRQANLAYSLDDGASWIALGATAPIVHPAHESAHSIKTA